MRLFRHRTSAGVVLLRIKLIEVAFKLCTMRSQDRSRRSRSLGITGGGKCPRCILAYSFWGRDTMYPLGNFRTHGETPKI
ncbi:hypothetical protein CHELA1G11_20251 [Hyphomicrobiales bacterium]|nr:hypothetical protein CHELA1G11_20251 [Hyphomicrobiales bacterium]